MIKNTALNFSGGFLQNSLNVPIPNPILPEAEPNVDAYIKAILGMLGQPNGIATLDADGKVAQPTEGSSPLFGLFPQGSYTIALNQPAPPSTVEGINVLRQLESMQTESTLRFKKGFLYLKPSANSSYNITRATLLNPNEYAAGYYAFSIERNASDTVIQLSPVTVVGYDPVNAGFQLNIDNSGNVYRGGYSPYLETMDYLAVPTWAAIHI